MINIGLNLAILIGLVQILGALGYFVFSIGQLTAAARSSSASGIAVVILQGLLVPLILLISGLILFFQGWRLDPVLQFQVLLMTVLTAYLIALSSGRSENR